MNFFLKRFILFLLPLIFILAFPFFIFFLNGEFIKTEKIFKIMLSGDPVLLGKILPYFSGNYSKLKILVEKKPEIFTLGNSRVLQFRSKFFKNSSSFFNGGGIESGFDGFRKIIRDLPRDYAPKIIIIGLEQAYFHEYSDTQEIPGLALNNEEENEINIIEILEAWRKIYSNLFNDQYSYSSAIKDRGDGIKRIGSMAKMRNAGFRNDGSYYYGYIIEDPNNKNHKDYNFKDTFRRIEKGTARFSYGDDISEKSIEKLIKLLDYCKSRNIHVIGFFPPYAQEVFDKMKSSGKYGYIFKLKNTLDPMFKSYGFSLFDYTDMNSFGGGEEEKIDGFHASEKADLKFFIDMAENDIKLAEYTNIGYLKERLENEKSNYDVFRFEY